MRSFDVSRNRPPRQRQKLGMPKPKKWNHQDELEALVDKTILVRVAPFETIKGVLVAADQYSLKIQVEGEDFARIVYKSTLIDIQRLA